MNHRQQQRILSARPRYLFLLVVLLMFFTSGRAQTSSGLDCTTCHADKAQALKGSAHGGLSCTTCHADIKVFPHPTNVALPECSQCHVKQASEYARSAHGLASASGNKAAPTCAVCHGDPHQLQRTNTWAFKKSIPELCGACHGQIYEKYHASVHGQAIARGVYEAPVCTTCHTAHNVEPPTNPSSTVFPTHIPETCGQCHANVRLTQKFNLPPDRLLSYDASFHGMALKEGSETVANCASCHGTHLILPSSDPRSTINPKNLPKTCGKCHPGAGERFALGPIHEFPGLAEPDGVSWVRDFYLVIIPLLIGLMFLHNAGDWIRKLADLRLRRIKQAVLPLVFQPATNPGEANDVRMYGFERLQHILLLLSFTVLVWTGFALKYPNGWWARPLLVWGWELRGFIHRIAAVVFMAVAGMHVISLIKSRRLRLHWKSLWPRLDDAREGFQTFAYNLGLRRSCPHRANHSYVEKAEYWAVVWGTALMSITGLMLWAHNLVLAWLPKSFLDFATAVHFYEAVLAALAIVVWHFYSVIFDPEVYPMDPAWLTGRSVRRRQGEPSERAEENEEEQKDEDEEESEKAEEDKREKEEDEEEGKQGQEQAGNPAHSEEENSKDG